MDTPVVFWGVNGRPLKYGLLDSLERPGHNVTGVYQAGYLEECLASFLTRLPSMGRHDQVEARVRTFLKSGPTFLGKIRGFFSSRS